MEYSKNYEKVKAYYELYLSTDGKRGWSLEKVQNAVIKEWITAEEYKEITGYNYP